MKAYLDCVPCAMRQALEASKMATDDRAKQEEALRAVASELSKIRWNGTPLTISHRAVRIVGEVTGVKDPYKDLKKEFNEKVMKMNPEMKRKVSESDDSLLTATKLSIAGNVIDFGPGQGFDVEEVVEETLNKGFAIDHFHDFREELKRAGDIIYLSDNTGEIAFDRLLLEEFEDKDVQFFVKASPVLNDAMTEDAEFVGIDELAEVREIGELDNLPEKFKDRLRKVDLVISKGQANYEAFSEVDANIFFLLMVKCPLIGKDIGVREGSNVVKWSGAQEG